ncbi:MAG: ABC transporter substrate-binding protein [Bryobacteraceae bacterium]|nr:ABC transporter substrate-binding protein [Bryobacteraceae bacterium]
MRLFVLLWATCLLAADPAVLKFCLRSEPKTFHPLKVGDDASETVRYLTAGTLVKINRRTQLPEASLATKWKTLDGGQTVRFQLREGLRFSDGTPFTAEDVAYTFQQVGAIRSGFTDSLRQGDNAPTATVTGKNEVTVRFAGVTPGWERLIDGLGIMSAKSPLQEKAVLGAFMVAEYKAGQYVVLGRNPHYWVRDAQGKPLPRVDQIRMDITANRDLELMRFKRGEVHMINKVDPDAYQTLATQMPEAVRNAGVSFESEQLWFNQYAKSPLPAYKLEWFRSTVFRRAVSESIRRADLAKIAMKGLAVPGVGPVSPGNTVWFNTKLAAHPYAPSVALAKLQKAGFRKQADGLYDAGGHRVEFSIVTNAGNKTRERLAAMIQADLGEIGIRVSVVTLDFPSLLERITRGFNYEACLLGLTNVDQDPNGQMNVWLSNTANHQWNPNQAAPETPWEAEIDKLMRAQARTVSQAKRKELFDRVQAIVHEQAPFIYLVHKNVLTAIHPTVRHSLVTVLFPHVFSNAEEVELQGAGVYRSAR